MIKMTATIIIKSHIPIASAAAKIPKNISAITNIMVAMTAIKNTNIPVIILLHLSSVLSILFFYIHCAKSVFAQ
jgi:hypothetical protein